MADKGKVVRRVLWRIDNQASVLRISFLYQSKTANRFFTFIPPAGAARFSREHFSGRTWLFSENVPPDESNIKLVPFPKVAGFGLNLIDKNLALLEVVPIDN